MPRNPPPSGPEGTVWFGGHPKSAELCFRVCGDNLDPDQITHLLGRALTHSQRKGEPVLKSERVARTGTWILREPVAPDATISEAIEALLDSFPGDDGSWTALSERNHLELLCDVFVCGINQGFVLSQSTLAMLVQRDIELGIDIYCDCDEGSTAELDDRFEATRR